MATCKNYVGVTCVNGNCPNAIRYKFPEYDLDKVLCDECWHNEGCKDCIFNYYGICEVQGMAIKVKYHGKYKIQKIKQGDWIDLRTQEDIELKKMEFKLISLGVSIELPEGYEALVVPRSSTFKNFGVIQANSIGIIDESYKGDNDIWHFPALALHHTFIPKGTRICQFRLIEHQPCFDIEEVKELKNKNRGGIGSTGIK